MLWTTGVKVHLEVQESSEITHHIRRCHGKLSEVVEVPMIIVGGYVETIFQAGHFLPHFSVQRKQ